MLYPASLPWFLPVVIISPEWFTGPEQGKSSGRTAAFSLWTGMFRDRISCIAGGNIYTAVTGSSFLRLWEQGIPRESEDDCWGWTGCSITHRYPLYSPFTVISYLIIFIELQFTDNLLLILGIYADEWRQMSLLIFFIILSTVLQTYICYSPVALAARSNA